MSRTPQAPSATSHELTISIVAIVLGIAALAAALAIAIAKM